MRVLIGHNPLAPIYDLSQARDANRFDRPIWIAPAKQVEAPVVFAYRLRFVLDAPATTSIHVSADERYELFLDGARLGRGPERGSHEAWFYETYALTLPAGAHVLVARVWALGELAPLAQETRQPGFLLLAQGPLAPALSTGVANWEIKRLGGYEFTLPPGGAQVAWFVGPNQSTDAARFSWGAEAGVGEGWELVAARVEDASAPYGILPDHPLRPALLPPQISVPRHAGTVRFAAGGEWADPQLVFVPAGAGSAAEVRAWQALADSQAPVLVPPHSRRQVVLDLGDYYCAYPRLVTSGGQGSVISVAWAEALYRDAGHKVKGQRDEIENRYFFSLARDIFKPDGGRRRFESVWWRSGRYIQVLVETADAPLTVEELSLEETRYPLEMESRFSTAAGTLESIVPLALRALQMCAHETYMDCPYYEQLMYVGDTRLEVLTTYAISRDDRLARKALALFDVSRLPSGMVRSRYPCRDVQVIPPFALWWVAMVHDFARWRDDKPFVVALLPGVRHVIESFLGLLNGAGVLSVLDGWNFEDWVPDWPRGNPPGSLHSTSGLINWHLLYTLGLAAELEEWAGAPELALRLRHRQQALGEKLIELFWDEGRGLLADDLEREHFSEHTQCLALLSAVLPGEHRQRAAAGLLRDPTLTRTTIYFTHYLFETYRVLRQDAAFFERLGLWLALPGQGFKTTPEKPEPSRSDCHGWGAHPLYHLFATVLGIRPLEFGFGYVEIAPLLGRLGPVSGSLVHPRGQIDVQLESKDSRLRGTISLPEGVTGRLRYGQARHELMSGRQDVDLPADEPGPAPR